MPCARCGAWIQRPRWRLPQSGGVLYAVCEPTSLLEEWGAAHAALCAALPVTDDALGRRLGELAELAGRVRRAWDCERSAGSAPDPVMLENDEASEALALPPPPRREELAATAAAQRQQHLEDISDADLVAELSRRLKTRLVRPRAASPSPLAARRARGRNSSVGRPW